VNSEPKAFASLSSGLLARKGAARPAMRPQGFGQAGAGLEDLGWNDMGFEPPKPALAPVRDSDHDAFGEELGEGPRASFGGLSPVQSPVHSQQAQIVDRLAPSNDGEDEVDETAEIFEAEPAVEFKPKAMVEFPAEVVETEVDFAPVAFVEPEPAPVAEVAPEPVPEPVFVPVAAPAAAAPRRAPRPRSAPGASGKAAFTLRLNPDRHLKLRLACAVTGRSAQLLVTDALDALLASMPELDAMAAKANRKG
jgi:hypothetical protein